VSTSVSTSVSALDFDGTRWERLDMDDKAHLVMGYAIAMDNVTIFCQEADKRMTSNKDLDAEKVEIFSSIMDMMDRWADYSATIGEVIDKVDRYYFSNRDSLDSPVGIVLLNEFGKGWW